MILPELDKFYLFIITAVLMIIIPGPAIIYIMTKSIDQGSKAGVISTLGIETGGLVHVVGASLGLSAIFMMSSTAFLLLKYCGAVYLIYLGIRKITSKVSTSQKRVLPKKAKLKKLYIEGIVVNVLNPKTALFFFMFLPQFISEEKGNIHAQILFLGTLFVFICTLIDLIYVVISGRLGGLINSSILFQRINNYLVGSIYLILGTLTLLVDTPIHTDSTKFTKV